MAGTRTTEYAVRALVALALGGDSGQVKQAAALAQMSGTPAKFLEQVLRSLRKGGFVKSRRGAGGGYELARSAETIRMSEVVAWMEGDTEPSSGRRGDVLGEEWFRIKAQSELAAQAVLASENLAKLLEKVKVRGAAKGKLGEYQI